MQATTFSSADAEIADAAGVEGSALNPRKSWPVVALNLGEYLLGSHNIPQGTPVLMFAVGARLTSYLGTRWVIACETTGVLWGKVTVGFTGGAGVNPVGTVTVAPCTQAGVLIPDAHLVICSVGMPSGTSPPTSPIAPDFAVDDVVGYIPYVILGNIYLGVVVTAAMKLTVDDTWLKVENYVLNHKGPGPECFCIGGATDCGYVVWMKLDQWGHVRSARWLVFDGQVYTTGGPCP
jgi:hypothetical protein